MLCIDPSALLFPNGRAGSSLGELVELTSQEQSLVEHSFRGCFKHASIEVQELSVIHPCIWSMCMVVVMEQLMPILIRDCCGVPVEDSCRIIVISRGTSFKGASTRNYLYKIYCGLSLNKFGPPQ